MDIETSKTESVENELVDSIARGISDVIDDEIDFQRKYGNLYERIVETWIEPGSSPFPNQDRKWRTIIRMKKYVHDR